MSERDSALTLGLTLSDAITLLRDELLHAHTADTPSEIHVSVESMTVELSVTAKRSADGETRFMVTVADEQGTSASVEHAEQKVTVVFGAPTDRRGRNVKVSGRANISDIEDWDRQ
jgi:Trypsin-co-occurring domain 2